jgi:hypothetical protein
MSRAKKDSSEDWRRYKKLEQENEKLKREVSKLRKILNAVIVDNLEERATRIEEGMPAIEHICDFCGKNKLEVLRLKRADGDFEIRLCLICNHRSQMKKVKSKELREN